MALSEEERKERAREATAKYRAKDIEAARERSRRYAAKRRADYETNEHINARRRERYETEPEYRAKRVVANARQRENPEFRERLLAYNKAYGPAYHAEKKADPAYLARKREEGRKRRLNAGVRLHQAVSRRLNLTLRGGKDGKRTEQILGYSGADLRDHLESRLQPGMTWENYGKVWEIDHFLPMSRFPYETADEENFRVVWALENLWPLWRTANRRKSGALLSPVEYSDLLTSTAA